MSILTSLLEYSSLNNSNRQQRSMSSSNRFFVDDVENHSSKPSSKSVSKMNIAPINANIDPKTRILHRIAHKFSMKFRKYFYQFFVKLQNMKKAGFSMKALKQTQQLKNKYNKPLQKLDQSYNIIYSKIFQNVYKTETFNKIKQISVKNYAVIKIANICEKKYIEGKRNSFFDQLRQMQKLNMKLDIFCSAVMNVFGCKIQQEAEMSEIHQFLAETFQLVKSLYLNEKVQVQEEITAKDSLTPTKIVEKSSLVQDSLIDMSAISNRSNSFRREQKQPLSTRKRGYNQQSSINFSASKQDSPIKVSNPLQFFVKYEITPSLSSKTYLNNWKAYPVITNYKQEPIMLQLPIQHQTKPRHYSKIQQDKISNQIGDIHDKFKIFNEFKNELQNSNVTQTSKISNYYQAENYNGTFGRKFETSVEEKSKSSIVYGMSLSNSESLTHLLSSRDKNSLVHFGSEAVNFKNLLVTERESMKKSQFRQITGRDGLQEYEFKKKNTIFNDYYDIDALCQSNAKKYATNEPLSIKTRPVKSSSITNNVQTCKMPQKKMEWKRYSCTKGTTQDNEEQSNLLQLNKFGFSVPLNSDKNKSFSYSDSKFWRGIGTTKESERPMRQSHGFIAQKRPSIPIGNNSSTTKRPSSGDTWQNSKACQYIKLKHRKN